MINNGVTELDKYEYNLKLEEIDKLVDQKDYEEAAKMADTIDWKRVRNVRTLCLISEIYEASGRLEDSKELLLRAYRRSPVGRTVLYRLVEITTALHQYDEAMEYYTEYVQAAPHDNNRYILKYQIYRGRGASVEELIEILEEYLGQEYTERWAYELAKLYQKAGQMQKCLAACDDLVLWFHSGKYVLKALELKKKYAPLTPKQQEIYEQQYLDSEPEEELPEEPDDVITKVKSTDGEVIAESIMAETEKKIADEVTAHKAEIEQEMTTEAERTGKGAAPAADQSGAAEGSAGVAYDDKKLQMELARSMREIVAGVVKRTEEEEESTPVVTKKLQAIPPMEMTDKNTQTAARLTIDDVLLSMGERGKAAQIVREAQLQEAPEPAAAGSADSIRERPEPAAAEAADGIHEGTAESVSEEIVDDISGEIVGEVPGRTVEEASEAAMAERRDAMDPEPEQPRIRRTVAEEAREELTEDQKEALRYTSNPEKLLRNRNALPTYREEHMPKEEVSVSAEETIQEDGSETQAELQKTRRIDYTREDLQNEMMSGKTIRVPVEKIASLHQRYGLKELWQEQGGMREAQSTDVREPETSREAVAEKEPVYSNGAVTEKELVRGRETASEKEPAFSQEAPDSWNAESEQTSSRRQNAFGAQEPYAGGMQEENSQESPLDLGYPEDENAGSDDCREIRSDAEPADEQGAEAQYRRTAGQDGPFLPDYMRGLFGGFTEVEGLEPQIANAVIQAVSNQGDRTSRSGNILIFGAHGSGKTTLAMNIAKAVAQDKGTGALKLAKIYAADLNRKDIAATIARIAGGTLIIEEAGDLEPGVIDQLTTAMEFRTDGLLIILEDEEQYIHDLLMSHPRFTMKFTAQIYLPVYTAEELLMFAQHAANAQGYVIGQDGMDELYQRISGVVQEGKAVSVTDVTELVTRAIHKSNKLLRKMSMGKKRYDDNDYIILFAKDFK